MALYKKVDTSLNFVEREKAIVEYWNENKVFEKSMSQKEGGAEFSFYDGPPTANGKPHIGHILTRVMKDIVPRYQTMKGKHVLRKAGWDTHGLPVELEVEKMLGIQVHFTSTISLTNFIKLCDIVGGVRVFIPNPVDYVSEEGERWLLPSGAVNLDGDKVRVYLKYKLDDETETDVQERYQNIMAAFLTGLHDKNFILFNNNTYQLINNCINTNLREDEEETLYSMIAAIDTESLIHQTITGSWRNVDNQQLLMPLNNGEFIKEAVKQLTNMLKSEDGTITSRVYVIEIKNGTEIQGLARRTSTLYKDASYDVLAAVNADSQDYEQTVIIDHIGNETAAKNVGELIRCTNIKQIDSTTEVKDYTSEAKVDFTIILGKDFNGRYVVKKSSN